MNRKRIVGAMAMILLVAVCGVAFASQSSPDPPTPIDVIETGKLTWSAFTAGKWVLGLGLALTLVIQLFRAPWLGGIVQKIPARWRVFVPVALSGLASALLSLAGELEPEMAALLAPAMAGVAIGTHELGEAIFRRRERYRTGLISLLLGAFLLGGCMIRPPLEPLQAPLSSAAGGEERIEVSIDDRERAQRTWCRTRQERRWWSSALAQAAGVLAGGLAASALVRDDDRIELGLEVGSLVSASVAAGAQTYSGAQASAYEAHCGDTGQTS